jgi:hypothetical protein
MIHNCKGWTVKQGDSRLRKGKVKVMGGVNMIKVHFIYVYENSIIKSNKN